VNKSSIPFIDLKAQYLGIKDEVLQGIEAVLEHGQYILGPEVAELESQLSEFCGAKHSITCSSGTDALLLGLMAYDVGPGDAIFTSPFTFFATAEVIALTGATPVFVDIDERTFNIDPEQLEAQIVRIQSEGKLNIKGVMPVNIFGLPADYDRINTIAERFDMHVIEDTAQGFGGTYHGRKSGVLADISATSFFPAKPLGCYGDGGAVFTNDDALAEKMLSIRVHGQGENKYDNVRLGLNARFDTIQAAVLKPKLSIFPNELSERERVAHSYTQELRGIVETPYIPEGCTSAWAQYSILSDDRDKIQKALSDNNIPSVVYYKTPCHLSTAFSYLGYSEGDMPVSEKISKKIFSLPMHPYLSDLTIKEIAKIIADA